MNWQEKMAPLPYTLEWYQNWAEKAPNGLKKHLEEIQVWKRVYSADHTQRETLRFLRKFARASGVENLVYLDSPLDKEIKENAVKKAMRKKNTGTHIDDIMGAEY